MVFNVCATICNMQKISGMDSWSVEIDFSRILHCRIQSAHNSIWLMSLM
jgi:hypothetical protein